MGIEYYQFEACNMMEVKTCSNDLHAYKSHLHQELSIGFVQRGATNLDVNGRDYYIRAGEAVIIYPFVSHMCRPVDIKDWAYTMIYIDNEFCKGLFNPEQQLDSIGIKQLRKEELIKIKNLVETLKSDSDPFDREVELASVIIDLVENVNIHIKLDHNKKMNDIKAYIELNFLVQLQLFKLEQLFGINKFALIREFRRMYNTTPNAFQLQLKVNYGKKLLKSCSDIVEVALESGFYDQAHFTKEFKKSYGITPMQYYKSICK